MYPVEFTVKIWDDLNKKEEICHGITFADNYTKAMKKIEKYYGDDIMEVLYIALLEEESIYEIEETQDNMARGKFKLTLEEWY